MAMPGSGYGFPCLKILVILAAFMMTASGAEDTLSPALEDSLSDSVATTPEDSCVQDGIFAIPDNKRAFYKCVLDNPPVSVSNNRTFVFRKYIMECPVNTYFDPMTNSCLKEEDPKDTKLPLVVGSILGVLKNSETGNCLRSTLKNHVITAECTGGYLEGWDISNDGRIKNAQTRKCLDGDEEGHVLTANCNGKTSQKWSQDGARRYVNLGSGRCLASNVVGYVHTGICNDGDYKKWE